MRRLAIALALLAALCSAAPAAGTGGVRWRPYADALKEAGRAKKLVMVVLHAKWCAPCRVMARTTWVDPAVVALANRAVVPVEFDLDADAEPIRCGPETLPPSACASLYWRTPGLPAFVLVDHEGEFVHQEMGLFGPELMKSFLEEVEKETPEILRELRAWKDSVARASK